MKKIIALLLLLILSVETSCFAAEIIVGADGQARYADGKETPVKQDVKVVKSDIVEDTTQITTKAELNKKIAPYEKKNLEIINKADKTIDYQEALQEGKIEYLTPQSYNVKQFQLQDGDYALWIPSDKSTQYAAEYHKDGSCMGIVKIKKINRKTVVFYEYRSESLEAKTAPIKHIMIAYNDKHQAGFIYTVDNNLRCCQFDNKTYAVNLPGLPEVQEIDLNDIKTEGMETRKDIANTTGVIVASPFLVVGAAMTLPFALLTGVAFLAYCVFFWDGSWH